MSVTLGNAGGLRRRGRLFRGWDRFDYVMVLAALGLVTYGLLLIYSGSRAEYDGPMLSLSNPVARQAIFAIFGVGTMLAVARVDYHYLTHYWWLFYAGSFLLLLALPFLGTSEFGATRWFSLGPIQVQPSEFAKIALILTLAHFFQEWGGDAKQLRSLVVSMLFMAPIAGIVFIQPDLGTAIIIGCIWLGMVIVAGVSRTHLIVFGALGIALLPFAWAFFVEDYQVERISTMLDPYEDQGGLGSGYNNIQVEIAIGSGGMLGKGLTNGDQTQLEYLKVPTRDFIFAVGAEELGFAGAMGLFALFILLLMRGIRAAQLAGDATGQLIAVGIVILILMQAFINLAVNLGLFPVTGLPLPFVSQGGSSLVSLFLSLGLLQSIITRHRAYRQA
jgi:rod shape determining protein RodA